MNNRNGQSIKVFVCYSFEVELLHEFASNPSLYVPFFNGNGNPLCECRYSNCEDPISQHCKYYGDILMQYWLGNHLDEAGNPDFIASLPRKGNHLQWLP